METRRGANPGRIVKERAFVTRTIVFTGLTSWAAIIALGFSAIHSYSVTPGRQNHPASDWPADTALSLDDNNKTLLVFFHPRCGCSRATLAELARIEERCRDHIRIDCVVLCPDAHDPTWKSAPLVNLARTIPNTQIVFDIQGEEAKRFGVSTSGHALLFDTRGNLEFSGGITLTRAHEGDNAGRDAIEAIATNHIPSTKRHHVFGCDLFPPNESPGR